MWKELRFHNELLANKLREGSEEDAAAVWRNHVLTNSQQGFMAGYESRRQEAEMEARLRSNPFDAEANKFFGDRIEKVRQEATVLAPPRQSKEGANVVSFIHKSHRCDSGQHR